MAEIKKQAPKAPKPVSPEVQALLDQKAKIAAQIKEINKAERTAKVQARKDESAQAWSIFRYVQKHLSDPTVKALVENVGKGLAPHDGYPAEKVESDKAALRRLLGGK